MEEIALRIVGALGIFLFALWLIRRELEARKND